MPRLGEGLKLNVDETGGRLLVLLCSTLQHRPPKQTRAAARVGGCWVGGRFICRTTAVAPKGCLLSLLAVHAFGADYPVQPTHSKQPDELYVQVNAGTWHLVRLRVVGGFNKPFREDRS